MNHSSTASTRTASTDTASTHTASTRSTRPSSTRTGRRSVLGGIASGLALLAVATLTPGCAIDQAFGGSRDSGPVTSAAPAGNNSSGNNSSGNNSSGNNSSGNNSSGNSSTGTSPSSPTPDASVPSSTTGAPDTTGAYGLTEQQTAKMEQDISDATEVVDDYWAAHWSDYFTGDYLAPKVVGLYDGSDPYTAPMCNGEPLTADNAAYCSDGDYVAWDGSLMARSAELGNSWVYLVVAHEWGHAMIAGLTPSLQWNANELQADCMAGAALYGAARDGSVTLPDDFEKQIASDLADVASDSAWTQEGDHGDAFERIDAFNDGRTGGVDACLPQ